MGAILVESIGVADQAQQGGESRLKLRLSCRRRENDFILETLEFTAMTIL